jgi:hypothetical protein
MPATSSSFSFLLHTYLVWVAAINAAVHHRLVPALHIAAEQFVQRAFGPLTGAFFGTFHLVDLSFHHSLGQ